MPIHNIGEMILDVKRKVRSVVKEILDKIEGA